MTQVREDASMTGCTLGLIALLLIGLALVILGWDVTGKLCLFIGMVISVVRALQHRQLDWLFSDHPLRRASHPFIFWSFVALYAALAGVALWALVEEFR